jgi:acetolactate synthase-1/2/3 large subunit
MHELATIVQESLAVKIAILNNGFLGLPRQWQELLYEKRFVGSPLYGPDYVKIADAYGIPGLRVKRKEDVIGAIDKAMAFDGPFLIDFNISPEENVYPFVPQGASLEEFLEGPKKEEALWQRQNTR